MSPITGDRNNERKNAPAKPIFLLMPIAPTANEKIIHPKNISIVYVVYNNFNQN
ncbi:hypothetical protein D3C73_1358150 [compost metagenome]